MSEAQVIRSFHVESTIRYSTFDIRNCEVEDEVADVRGDRRTPTF